MVFGLAATLYFGRGPQNFGFANPLEPLFDRLGGSSESAAAQALIVTADPRNRLTAVATLSPRGFSPLLAGNKSEVLSQIRNHPHAVKLAVIDTALPDFALIARALKDILPASRIIVLNASTRSEEVGPILLDRLGALRSTRLAPPERRVHPVAISTQPFRVM
jgi:CheY-like chemotaxis protein